MHVKALTSGRSTPIIFLTSKHHFKIRALVLLLSWVDASVENRDIVWLATAIRSVHVVHFTPLLSVR